MTIEQEGEAAQFVDLALQRIRQEGRDLVWTLKNGITIRCRSIPNSYLQALREGMPVPPVPVVPGAGDEPEENPDDPRYRQALRDHEAAFERAAQRLVLGMATSLEGPIPEGLFGPDDPGWLQEVRRSSKFTGVEIPLHDEDPDQRYVDWLRYYAVDNEADLWTIGYLPTRLGGLQQGEVAKVLESFRDYETRGADLTSAPPRPNSNRNRGNRAARRASR